MAREVNVNDPNSWNEEDLVWLRARPERVPEQYRDRLELNTPSQHGQGEAVEISRLRSFLEANYSDEMGAADGESPIAVAIRLLTPEDGDASLDSDDDSNYEDWKVAELRDEVEARRNNGRTIDVGEKATKAELVAALRADDVNS